MDRYRYEYILRKAKHARQFYMDNYKPGVDEQSLLASITEKYKNEFAQNQEFEIFSLCFRLPDDAAFIAKYNEQNPPSVQDIANYFSVSPKEVEQKIQILSALSQEQQAIPVPPVQEQVVPGRFINIQDQDGPEKSESSIVDKETITRLSEQNEGLQIQLASSQTENDELRRKNITLEEEIMFLKEGNSLLNRINLEITDLQAKLEEEKELWAIRNR